MYLLASRSGILTGRQLAYNLNLRFSTDPERIPRDSNILVRYGNARQSYRIHRDTDVNSTSAIMRMSNKHLLWKVLEESNIIVPKYFEYDGDGRYPRELQPPFLFRERLRRGGRDIIVVNDVHNLPRKEGFLVPYYETSREYRVHVVFGEIIKLFRKLSDTFTVDESMKIPIRSSYFGWHYRLANLDQIVCAESLVTTCKEATKEINCAFCGIDIAWSRIIKRWIIWEINSAPSLNGTTLDIYTDMIKEHFRKQYEIY